MSILRAKYKVRNNWLRKEPSRSTSPFGKAIEGVKEIIVKGACYLIKDGASINVLLDLWVPWIQNFIPKPTQLAFAETPLMVSMLIDGPSHRWKESLILQLFKPSFVEANFIHSPCLKLKQRQTHLGALLKRRICSQIGL